MSRPVSLLLSAGLIGVAFASCREGSSRDQPIATVSPDGGAPVHQARTSTLSGELTLTARLAAERVGRPPGTPSVEVVVTALGRAGILVAPPNQALATIVGAHYCAWTQTASGLGLAICEYDSTAAAEAGRAGTTIRFAPVEGRTTVLNGKTTLTLRRPDASGQGDPEAERIIRLFSGL